MLSVCPWTCSNSNSHGLGASFFADFCVFNLGTYGAFSAIQRHRFVHGHVHILIPMAWEHRFLQIFAFPTWRPLVPSARFSAIGLPMDMFIFFWQLFPLGGRGSCAGGKGSTGQMAESSIFPLRLRSFWMVLGTYSLSFWGLKCHLTGHCLPYPMMHAFY